jgi:hypothetical protein
MKRSPFVGAVVVLVSGTMMMFPEGIDYCDILGTFWT